MISKTAVQGRNLSKNITRLIMFLSVVFCLLGCEEEASVMNEQSKVQVQQNSVSIVTQPLSCQLSMRSPQKLTDSVTVDFTIQNNSDEEILLLTWYTPLEGFFSNLFIITNNSGQTLDYQGAMVKRLSPTLDDYHALAAGESVSVSLDLRLAYQLLAGDYTLVFNKPSLKVRTKDNKIRAHQCQSAPIRFSVL